MIIFYTAVTVSKYLSKREGRCYTVFVDFSKAFDSIPHSHMFYRMFSEGIRGRIMNVLQNMYSKFKSCVQVDINSISELSSVLSEQDKDVCCHLSFSYFI